MLVNITRALPTRPPQAMKELRENGWLFNYYFCGTPVFVFLEGWFVGFFFQLSGRHLLGLASYKGKQSTMSFKNPLRT